MSLCITHGIVTRWASQVVSKTRHGVLIDLRIPLPVVLHAMELPSRCAWSLLIMSRWQPLTCPTCLRTRVAQPLSKSVRRRPSCTTTMQSLGVSRIASFVAGVQLLRELQQHRLYASVEASLKQKSRQETAEMASANGKPDGNPPHQSSSGEHDAERVTVYLLLAPMTSWEAVQSQVSVLPQMEPREKALCMCICREGCSIACFAYRREV